MSKRTYIGILFSSETVSVSKIVNIRRHTLLECRPIGSTVLEVCAGE